MINSKDFRIGNLIDRGDYICLVSEIKEDGIITTPIDYKGERFVLQEINPIPLTEEWLLKFGFTLINKVDYITVDFAIYQKGDILWEDCGKAGFNDSWFDGSAEYVHQLQNLVFALTGEELEIKKA